MSDQPKDNARGAGDCPSRPMLGTTPPERNEGTRESEAVFGFIRDFRILDPTLRELLALWSTRCVEGALPRTRDMGPDFLRGLVTRIALVDVQPEPLDFRYRIVGSYVEDMLGEKRTGMRAREIFFGSSLELVLRATEDLLRFRQPVAMWGTKMPWIDRDYKRWHVLVLPLSESGVTVDRAIMGFAFL
ncbi:MAG: PAS domain-containing protein [Alphaproteobacteria bacterium]|nr:MAG: PAS domain-containing protein [Alphaproteobacteria bacterium]